MPECFHAFKQEFQSNGKIEWGDRMEKTSENETTQTKKKGCFGMWCNNRNFINYHRFNDNKPTDTDIDQHMKMHSSAIIFQGRPKRRAPDRLCNSAPMIATYAISHSIIMTKSGKYWSAPFKSQGESFFDDEIRRTPMLYISLTGTHSDLLLNPLKIPIPQRHSRWEKVSKVRLSKFWDFYRARRHLNPRRVVSLLLRTPLSSSAFRMFWYKNSFFFLLKKS